MQSEHSGDCVGCCFFPLTDNFLCNAPLMLRHVPSLGRFNSWWRQQEKCLLC